MQSIYYGCCILCSSTVKTCIYFQEHSIREVQVNSSPASLKDIYVADATREKVKVTLWRPSAVEVKPGDYIAITDCVVNNYRNERSLSATATTSVKVSCIAKH